MSKNWMDTGAAPRLGQGYLNAPRQKHPLLHIPTTHTILYVLARAPLIYRVECRNVRSVAESIITFFVDFQSLPVSRHLTSYFSWTDSTAKSLFKVLRLFKISGYFVLNF